MYIISYSCCFHSTPHTHPISYVFIKIDVISMAQIKTIKYNNNRNNNNRTIKYEKSEQQ